MSRMPPRVLARACPSRAQTEELLLRQAGSRDVVEVHRLELTELLDPLEHRREVGEHAAQPTLVDVGHADTLGLLGDRPPGLLLGADEQDWPPLRDRGLLDEGVGLVDEVSDFWRSMM
jgi:hypothetical protein